jgi:hypothetical protein
MLDKVKLEAIAKKISRNILIDGLEYSIETGIIKDDFITISHQNFDGEIFAVDGSNVVIWDWSAANLNFIRAGYVVYKGRNYQRTVVTYNDVFLMDTNNYEKDFEKYLIGYFGLHGFILKGEELDRITTYFRELQEYIALSHAIKEANYGDLVIYDGGFTWKKRPLGKVLEKIFNEAMEKGVNLLGISKSSSFVWGKDIKRPFLWHTSVIGNSFLPRRPWYLRLKGKCVQPGADGWDGEVYVARLDGRSNRAFRIDVPNYIENEVESAFGKLAAYSCSSECIGYPHALFRAHRDIRITEKEAEYIRFRLLDTLSENGFTEAQIRGLMLDYHDVIEMRTRSVL